MANVDPTVGPPAGHRSFPLISLSVVWAEPHTGYSNSASFAIFTLTYIYPAAAVMLSFVLGFFNVCRVALSQNKQLGCVTNMAAFLPCKSIQLVISNKWHFQLIVPGLLSVCVNAHSLLWKIAVFCNMIFSWKHQYHFIFPLQNLHNIVLSTALVMLWIIVATGKWRKADNIFDLTTK